MVSSNSNIRKLCTEAHEIVTNIRAAAQHGEITWQQRDELINLVMTDVHTKIELAGNLLHDWTGSTYGDYPLAR